MMEKQPSVVAAVYLTLVLTIGQRACCQEIEVDRCIVRFASEVEIPALETGQIQEVFVDRNQVVKKGNEIARLDDRALLLRRRSAQSRVDSAKDDADDLIEIQYADVALAEAKAELENTLSIQEEMRGTIPTTQVRRQRLAVERGQLEVARAKRRKQKAEVEVDLRRADLAAIDHQLNSLHVESPVDGVILELNHRPGEWVEKGETVAKVGQISNVNVTALVRSDMISPSQCSGLPVSVHWIDPVDGRNRSLSGRVSSVDPQSLPGGRFRLHAEIKNETTDGRENAWLLIPGTSVRTEINPFTLDPRLIGKRKRN